MSARQKYRAPEPGYYFIKRGGWPKPEKVRVLGTVGGVVVLRRPGCAAFTETPFGFRRAQLAAEAFSP